MLFASLYSYLYIYITEGGCERKEVGSVGDGERGRGLRPGGTWRSRPWIVELYIMCRDISTVGNLYRSYNILERSGGRGCFARGIEYRRFRYRARYNRVNRFQCHSYVRTRVLPVTQCTYSIYTDVSSTYMSRARWFDIAFRHIRIERERD